MRLYCRIQFRSIQFRQRKGREPMSANEIAVAMVFMACIAVAYFLPDRISVPMMLVASLGAVVYACLAE